MPDESGCFRLIITSVPGGRYILGPSTFGLDSFIAIAGKTAEGAHVVADYFVNSPDQMNQAFVRAYTEKYNVKPDNWAGMGYALASLAIQAIKDASPNPDREKVKDALTRLRNQPTVIGNHSWTMDDARNPHYGAVILTVKNGRFTPAPK